MSPTLYPIANCVRFPVPSLVEYSNVRGWKNALPPGPFVALPVNNVPFAPGCVLLTSFQSAVPAVVLDPNIPFTKVVLAAFVERSDVETLGTSGLLLKEVTAELLTVKATELSFVKTVRTPELSAFKPVDTDKDPCLSLMYASAAVVGWTSKSPPTSTETLGSRLTPILALTRKFPVRVPPPNDK